MALPPPFVCQAIALDGDTFRCGSTIIRLARIDAADRTRSRRCRTSKRAWCDDRYAALGKVALTTMIRGKQVRCVPVPATDRARTAYDRYGRVVAYCSVDGRDIGRAMMRSGLAKEWK